GSRSNCPRGPLASSSIAPNLGHGLAPIASSQKYIQWVHPTKHTAFYRLLLRAGRRPPSLSHGSWNAAVGLILTKIGIGRTHLILTRPAFQPRLILVQRKIPVFGFSQHGCFAA